MPLEYIDPVPVARLAKGAWSSYQKGDLDQVVAALPGLIKTIQQMEAASIDDAVYRRSCAAVGRFEDSLELGEVAARWLRPRIGVGNPAALSLYGMLYLRTAEQKSPGIVRHSVVVREVVRSMYRRAPTTGGRKSSPLLALAERCRAVG